VRDGACTAAQLGVARCPCAAEVAPAAYAAVVAAARRGMSSHPAVLLDPLAERMRALATAGRYEEAAAVRDRAAALSRAVQRQRRLETLRASGRLVVEVDGEGGAVLDAGRLTLAWLPGSRPLPAPVPHAPDGTSGPGPLAASEVDELAAVAAWLDSRAARLHLLACDQGLASPASRVTLFEASTRAGKGRIGAPSPPTRPLRAGLPSGSPG